MCGYTLCKQGITWNIMNTQWIWRWGVHIVQARNHLEYHEYPMNMKMWVHIVQARKRLKNKIKEFLMERRGHGWSTTDKILKAYYPWCGGCLEEVQDHEGEGVAGEGLVPGLVDPVVLGPPLHGQHQRPHSTNQWLGFWSVGFVCCRPGLLNQIEVLVRGKSI